MAQPQQQFAWQSDGFANPPSRSDTGGGMRTLCGHSHAASIVNATVRQRATSTQDAGEQRPAGSDGDTIEMLGTGGCGGTSAAALECALDAAATVQELHRSNVEASRTGEIVSAYSILFAFNSQGIPYL
jgi:hypothetical protein